VSIGPSGPTSPMSVPDSGRASGGQGSRGTDNGPNHH
jgi:hypothetical protein